MNFPNIGPTPLEQEAAAHQSERRSKFINKALQDTRRDLVISRGSRIVQLLQELPSRASAQRDETQHFKVGSTHERSIYYFGR